MSSDGKSVVVAPATATATAATAAAAPVTVTAEAVYDNSNTRDRKQQEWTDVQFKTVVFPSQPKRSFRVTVQRHGEVTLVVEDNQTHEKWTSAIEHPSKHGPDMSMPNEAFIAALEAALGQLNKDLIPPACGTVPSVAACIIEGPHEKNDSNADASTPKAGVTVDMVQVADAMNLTLRMHISVFWEPEYTFHLAHVGLKTVDLLAAQLRDVQEELHVYREKERLRKQCHLHLTSNSFNNYSSTSPDSGKLVWTSPLLNSEDDGAPFTLTEGNTEITVNYKGWYFIDSSVNFSNCPINKMSSSLEINGHKMRTVAATGQFEGLLLYQTAYLKAGDKLRIEWRRFSANNGILEAGSTLSIHLFD